MRKDLTLSAGVRQEYQSHIGGLHLGPRGGIRLVAVQERQDDRPRRRRHLLRLVRRAELQQGVQLDGTHQQIETIVQPGYPDAAARRTAVDPAGGPRAVRRRSRAAAAVRSDRRRRAELPGEVRVNAMYIRRRGIERAARRQRQRAARERRAAGSHRPEPSPRSSRSARSSVRRAERQRQLHAAAAAAVRRRELHARRDRSTRPTARSACRRTATISPAERGPVARRRAPSRS